MQLTYVLYTTDATRSDETKAQAERDPGGTGGATRPVTSQDKGGHRPSAAA